MKENIYNLFLEVNDGLIKRIGAIEYSCDGSDEDKFDFLKTNVVADFKKAKYFPVPDRYKVLSDGIEYNGIIRYETYVQLSQLGKNHELFIDIFNYYNSDKEPFICVTPIVNGEIRIDGEIPVKINTDEYNEIHLYSAPDYLQQYIRGNNFHANEMMIFLNQSNC